MRPEENIENLIKSLNFKASAELHNRTLNDVLEAHEKSKNTKSAKPEQNVWRMIMKNRITKPVAAAAVLVGLLIGISQFAGTRAAFAETSKAVRNTLEYLKQIVITGEMPPPEPQSEIRRVRLCENKSSELSNNIKARLWLFSTEASQDSLRNFFEKQNFEFSPTGWPNVSCATLDPDRVENLLAIAKSNDSIVFLKSQVVLLQKDGQEATVGSWASDLAFAFAVTPNVLDSEEEIDLSFSFHDGQLGFEIPRVRTKIGEGVLIWAVKATTEDGTDKHHTIILIQPEGLYYPET